MGKFIRKFSLGLFGPSGLYAALRGVAYFLDTADRTDFIVSLFGFAGIAAVIKWLADPPWLLPLALILWTVGFVAWALYQYTDGLNKKFIKKWEGLSDDRQLLRDLLPPAYEKWTGAPCSFEAFSYFVEAVMFPNNLPLKAGKIRLYAKQVIATASGDPKRLLDFCTAIYPREGESSILSLSDRKQLYMARMKLSKFWNKWAKECFEYGSIKENELRRFPHTWELMVLTYLELPLAIRNGDGTDGKQWLFRLTQKIKQSVI